MDRAEIAPVGAMVGVAHAARGGQRGRVSPTSRTTRADPRRGDPVAPIGREGGYVFREVAADPRRVRLAGGIAHDFNNVLLVISTPAEQIATDACPPYCRSEADRILRATRKGTALTRKLLEFGRPRRVPAEVDLTLIVREGLEFLGRPLGRGIQLVTELTPIPAPVRAERCQLERILITSS